ncbi:MAG: glycine oxidase ThiO [Candidatus Korobacteraceae bacterium]
MSCIYPFCLPFETRSLLYNRKVKSWDVVIVGGGVIGLSLAWRLKSAGISILVAEKHEPAREASAAAGGMIAHCDPHTPDVLLPLARASAEMYPDFVRELEIESGEAADFRGAGTIAHFDGTATPPCADSHQITPEEVSHLEPSLRIAEPAWFLPEPSVDPRGLGHALLKGAKRRGIDFITGSPVTEVLIANGRAAGVRTAHSTYPTGIVVNCAGAWAAQLSPFPVPTRPVKGQMVCLVPEDGGQHTGPLIKHVVRTPEIYIIPRSDGRILLGATVEEAGFDKSVDPEIIQRLYRAGINAAPALASMKIHDAWAGLRPGTPDNLPILGETSLPGYYAATGHYRDGIMLAPITAHVMMQLITANCTTDFDLRPFSPMRFASD